MKRYAIIDSDNLVDNIIIWDEAAQWSPPEGMTMVNVEGVLCDRGWKYENEIFTNPNPPIETPAEDTPAE